MRPTLLTLLVLPFAASAADWPMGGRGSDRNPVTPETSAPTDFRLLSDGAGAKNVKWTAKTGSRASGGPVVSGGLVWFGTVDRDPDGDRDLSVLVCCRESDGKELYRHVTPRRPGGWEVDWPGQSLSGSPLAEGDRLWFVTNRREVVCLDTGPLRRVTGPAREVWKLDMPDKLGVRPRALMIPGHDTYGSPAGYKDFLYLFTGNASQAGTEHVPAPDAPSLVCLRKDTGAVVWKDASPGKDMLSGQYASPLVVEVNGRAQVIHPQADGWVRSFDALTGKLLWKFDCNRKSATGSRGAGPGERVYVVAAPTFANGRVYFATGVDVEACWGDGRLFCVDPTKSGDVSPELPDGPGKGKPNPNSAVVWEFEADGPGKGDRMHLTTGSVAVTDGLVIAADAGYVHCLDEQTGKRLWSHDIKELMYGNPLVVGGKVYVLTQAGEVWVLELARTKKVLAKVEADHGFHATPVFANGTLFLLSEGLLYAVGAKP